LANEFLVDTVYQPKRMEPSSTAMWGTQILQSLHLLTHFFVCLSLHFIVLYFSRSYFVTLSRPRHHVPTETDTSTRYQRSKPAYNCRLMSASLTISFGHDLNIHVSKIRTAKSWWQ